MHGTALATTSNLPMAVWIAIAAGALVIGIAVGVLVGRRRGSRTIAQRLIALGSRLGAGPPEDECALSYLEQVTGAATAAVTESSADAIRLRRSLDTLPLGLVLCDESGSIIYRNASATTLMESRGGDALAAQAVTELLSEAWDKGQAEQTLDLWGPPRRSLGVNATLIDYGRRPLGVFAVIDDISERKRLDDVRRDFIANVSHELKTPMGALGLLAETLMDEKDRDVAKRLADRIHMEAFRVSRIIDDLLDLSRLESELELTTEPVPIDLVVVEAVDRVRSSAEQRNIILDASPLAEPISLMADRRQLVSAVHALLENAITYSTEGSVVTVSSVVTTQPDAPESDAKPSATSGEEIAPGSPIVRISVRDTGMGIPTVDLDRIFERFYRVDRGRSRETGGTGLGLAIVRHVATNHAGAVEVESREGEGSTFTLILPLPESV